MGPLVCDICGGKLVMGTGGIAVCDSCGIQYNKESLQEKVQQVKETVQINNSNMIENWIELGDSAYLHNNYQEAYDFFTKVVEVNPENWWAIWHRGSSAANLSEKGKSRSGEYYSAVLSVIRIIDELIKEKPDKRSYYEDMKLRLLDDFTGCLHDVFQQQGTDELKDYSEYLNYSNEGLRAIDRIEIILESYADVTNTNLVTELENKPNLEQDVVKEAKAYIALILAELSYEKSYHDKYGIHYFGFSEEEKKPLYEKYCKYELESWDESYYSVFGMTYPFNPFGLPPDGKYIDYDEREKRLKEYWKDPLARLKASEEKRLKREACETYWAEHEDERKILDEKISKATEERIRQATLYNERKQDLAEVSNKYDKQIGDLNIEVEAVKAEIDSLQAEQSNLGFLDFKKAKMLKESIQKKSEEYAFIRDKNTKIVQQLSIDKNNEMESIQSEMNEYSKKYNEEVAKEKELQDKLENPIKAGEQ